MKRILLKQEAVHKIKTCVSRQRSFLKEYQEFEESVEDQSLDDQDQIVQTLLSQGQHDNLSFCFYSYTKRKPLKCLEQNKEMVPIIHSIFIA